MTPELIENLAKQSSINRLCLVGKGIVCGLSISIDEDYGVCISSGNGITSNGHYVEVPQSIIFRYYQPATNIPDYHLFEGVDEDKIYELIQSGEPCISLKPQSSEAQRNPFLQDKVLVLYTTQSDSTIPMRFFLMEQSDVLRKMGIERMATRILWESLEDDEDFIYNDDYNQEDSRPRIDVINLAKNPAMRLPELYLKRLGFNNGDPSNCPPEGVDQSVFPEIKDIDDLFEAYARIIDDATRDLDKAIHHLYGQFKPILNKMPEEQIKSWIDLLCIKWEAFKKEQQSLEGIAKKYYIQYFYGWVRDLIQGYNEIRLDLIDLVSDCCQNPHEFSHHLFLGIALRPDIARLPRPLRHTIQQPPIYNGNANRLERINLYFLRELMMIKTFYLPDYIENPKINPFILVDDIDKPDYRAIKITPSRCYNQPLADQSIPFYYPITWTPYSVHHFWNYVRTRTSSTDQLLSYHASDMDDSYTRRFHVIRPLHYKLDNYPMLRVEGHLGRPLNNIYQYRKSGVDDTGADTFERFYSVGIVDWLVNLRRKYSLVFNIKLVHIENENSNNPPTPLSSEKNNQFPDLNVNFDSDQANDIPTIPDSEKYGSFRQSLVGMEHLAGTKVGGTLFLVYQLAPSYILTNKDGAQVDAQNVAAIVVGDFFVPCCGEDDITPMIPIDDIDADNTAFPVIQTVEVFRQGAGATPRGRDTRSTPSAQNTVKEAFAAKVSEGKSLLESIGSAYEKDKDDLKFINGIGPKYEKELNKIGIFTYKQLSKMSEKEYELVDQIIGSFKGRGKRDKWAEQAFALMNE